MNEKARMDRSHKETPATPDPQSLFAGAAVEQDDADDYRVEASQATDQAAETDGPRLTLCRHDEDVLDDAEAALGDDFDEPVAADEGAASDDEHDNWPWDTDLHESKGRAAESAEVDDDIDDLDFDVLDRLTRPKGAFAEGGAADSHGSSAAPSDVPRHLPLEDDHSAIEDVVLSMPIVQKPVEETLAGLARKPDEQTDDAAKADVAESDENGTSSGASAHRAALPKRIGSGQLVPTRLTWRPGDPFGDSGDTGRRRFRWDVMLTSAGITAACGMGCIWLLRTILA